MDRDEIMHLVNETAPRYESWGCEAHFQLFAKRLMEREREACATVCGELADNPENSEQFRMGANWARERIRARGSNDR